MRREWRAVRRAKPGSQTVVEAATTRGMCGMGPKAMGDAPPSPCLEAREAIALAFLTTFGSQCSSRARCGNGTPHRRGRILSTCHQNPHYPVPSNAGHFRGMRDEGRRQPRHLYALVVAQLAVATVATPSNCAPAPDHVLHAACAALNFCSAHGKCVDSVTVGRPQELPCTSNVTAACLCQPEWTGDRCDVMTCPHGCHGHGVCLGSDGHKRCSCDEGYGGADCGTPECPGGCSGHGVCGASLTCTCEPGWAGKACDQRACAPSADCSGHGLCVDGACHCEGGWQGDACHLLACPGDCSGHGACRTDGTCECARGYGGADCSDLACPGDCSQHGRCIGYGSSTRACKCDDGWGGEDCATKTCPAPGCGAHGACVDGACLCANGFAGPNCSTPLCPAGCSGHGHCEGAACKCDEGWTGEACAERACVGGCAANQICYEGACACAPGFTGLDSGCTTKVCEHECGPHGRCTDGACVCASGYSGARCDERVCPVGGLALAGDGVAANARGMSSTRAEGAGGRAGGIGRVVAAAVGDAPLGLVCSGHGECVDGTCVCERGYTSADCSRRACENDCSGHGHCAADGACSCHSGWFGPDCALPSCFRNCSGHGACEATSAAWLGSAAAPQGLCKCDPGWHGVGCELRSCPGSTSADGGVACGSGGCVECSGHGTCNTGTGACECAAPWSGESCSQHGCGPAGCGAHGKCVPIATVSPVTASLGRYACACEPGWTGADCSLRECIGGCGGMGWCHDGSCLCYPGSQKTDEGSCVKSAGRPRRLSLQCSLQCVTGCTDLCARQVSGGGSARCEAECSKKCLQVCASG